MSEKTLRELIVRYIYSMFGAGECGCSWNQLTSDAKEEYLKYADSILALMLSAVEGARLTPCCDGCYEITENMTTPEADVHCQNCTLKAAAAAQLEAVKKILGKV